MKYSRLFLIILIAFTSRAKAQEAKTASEILHEIKKLQNTTTVLYLAAHPDDENTKMISWLVNGAGARTAYLSLTRGDGGQNLIGTELGAELGVLRTQELMQARKIDGGEQFFSRAVDFGYSKTAKETLEKWGEQDILADVVWIIRKFKPDVIITRFPPDERAGHGHHTASAELGIKAFEMAADEKAFPGQLKWVNPWQPKRIYWNASTWWNPRLDSIAQADKSYITVETGGYNTLLGKSYNELASISRTQHKSQGFGVSVDRGAQTEYLKYLAGDTAVSGLFEGIPANWERFGFKQGDKLLNRIVSRFDVQAPERSLPDLITLKKASSAINDSVHRVYLQKKTNEIILHILGVYAEALAAKEYVNPGEEIPVKVEVILRRKGEVPVVLKKIEVGNKEQNVDAALPENERYIQEMSITVTEDVSQPYWLKEKYDNLFQVRERHLLGQPENNYNIPVHLTFETGDGGTISMEIPLIYKFSDRVEGEIINQVAVAPEVSVEADRTNLIFTKDQTQNLTLTFRLLKREPVHVSIAAAGWKVSPDNFRIDPDGKKEMISYEVSVTPLEGSETTDMEITVNGDPALHTQPVNYDHIDKRWVYNEVSPRLVKLDLKKKGALVGYIPGAGDRVAEAIEAMGYEVDILDENSLKTYELSNYKAIIAGVRAYNTQEWLPEVKPALMEYIRNGGNYIVQYNTRSRDLLSSDIGPYPFEISRERVTEEEAEAEFLIPEHPVLTKPNPISKDDFKDWVQERGLYFAGEWSKEYVAPIGWHDAGEPLREGGLIIANYGKGTFMYTGISFFRELPAGVPGAYRLLANMISYSNPVKNE